MINKAEVLSFFKEFIENYNLTYIISQISSFNPPSTQQEIPQQQNNLPFLKINIDVMKM